MIECRLYCRKSAKGMMQSSIACQCLGRVSPRMRTETMKRLKVSIFPTIKKSDGCRNITVFRHSISNLYSPSPGLRSFRDVKYFSTLSDDQGGFHTLSCLHCVVVLRRPSPPPPPHPPPKRSCLQTGPWQPPKVGKSTFTIKRRGSPPIDFRAL